MPVEYGIANIIIVALMELERTAASNPGTATKEKLLKSSYFILTKIVRKQ
jgi:hypothetical protein